MLENTSIWKVEKESYAVIINGYGAELVVFRGKLGGLVVIDFEFVSEQAKNAFTASAICLADATQVIFIAGGKLADKSYIGKVVEFARYRYTALTK